MKDKVKQTEINAMAWAACDTFRGVVDPAQYKDYILVMLFVKYISDVWKDHYEEYRKQYGDDEARIRRKLERERFVLPYAELKNHETGEVEDRSWPITTASMNGAASQYRRADQHRPGRHRRGEQGQAGRRLPQHRLQQRGQSRQDQGPQPPPEDASGGLQQAPA